MQLCVLASFFLIEPCLVHLIVVFLSSLVQPMTEIVGSEDGFHIMENSHTLSSSEDRHDNVSDVHL
jgi:hypothetical protein